MRVEILQIRGCPNVAVLEQRLREAAASERVDVEIVHWVVDDPSEAAAAGMAGSPTLLVDGREPFAVVGQVPSLSCRLYRSENGALVGAPSVAALRAAVRAAASGSAGGQCN